MPEFVFYEVHDDSVVGGGGFRGKSTIEVAFVEHSVSTRPTGIRSGYFLCHNGRMLMDERGWGTRPFSLPIVAPGRKITGMGKRSSFDGGLGPVIPELIEETPATVTTVLIAGFFGGWSKLQHSMDVITMTNRMIPGLAGLLLAAGSPAFGQYQVDMRTSYSVPGATTPQQFRGGIYSVPPINTNVAYPRINSSDLFITGNVRGGASFQGFSPIQDSSSLFISSPTSSLSNFNRDSFSVSDISYRNTPLSSLPYYDQSNTSTNVNLIQNPAFRQTGLGAGTQLSNPTLSGLVNNPIESVNLNQITTPIELKPSTVPLYSADRALSTSSTDVNQALTGGVRNQADASLFGIPTTTEADGSLYDPVSRSRFGGEGRSTYSGYLSSPFDPTDLDSLRRDLEARKEAAKSGTRSRYDSVYSQALYQSMTGALEQSELLQTSGSDAINVPNTLYGQSDDTFSSRMTAEGIESSTSLSIPTPYGASPNASGQLGGGTIRDAMTRQPGVTVTETAVSAYTEATDWTGRSVREAYGIDTSGEVPIDVRGITQMQESLEWMTDMRIRQGIAMTENANPLTLSQRAFAARSSTAVAEKQMDYFSAGADSRLRQYITQANDLLRSGQYYRAASMYALAESLDATTPISTLGRGHALLAAGEFQGAALKIADAIEKNPGIVVGVADLPSQISNASLLDIRRGMLEQRLAKNEDYRLRFLLGYIEYFSGLRDFGMGELEKAAAMAPPGSVIQRFPGILKSPAINEPLAPQAP